MFRALKTWVSNVVTVLVSAAATAATVVMTAGFILWCIGMGGFMIYETLRDGVGSTIQDTPMVALMGPALIMMGVSFAAYAVFPPWLLRPVLRAAALVCGFTFGVVFPAFVIYELSRSGVGGLFFPDIEYGRLGGPQSDSYSPGLVILQGLVLPVMFIIVMVGGGWALLYWAVVGARNTEITGLRPERVKPTVV